MRKTKNEPRSQEERVKRSEINEIIKDAKAFFDEMKFTLPPVAFWSPEQLKEAGPAIQEILDCGIGWDLTDFGFGDFKKKGLLLFTMRNGSLTDKRYPKTYAEKIMIVGEGQLTLTHYHWNKTEDIINRGGGNLIIKGNNASVDDKLADTPVMFRQDGVSHTVPAGSQVSLEPGESITLTPRLYHEFWGEPGRGTVLVGEISATNDDSADNCYLEPQLRFPEIEEDEPPVHLLVGDYKS